MPAWVRQLERSVSSPMLAASGLELPLFSKKKPYWSEEERENIEGEGIL